MHNHQYNHRAKSTRFHNDKYQHLSWFEQLHNHWAISCNTHYNNINIRLNKWLKLSRQSYDQIVIWITDSWWPTYNNAYQCTYVYIYKYITYIFLFITRAVWLDAVARLPLQPTDCSSCFYPWRYSNKYTNYDMYDWRESLTLLSHLTAGNLRTQHAPFLLLHFLPIT